MNVIAFGTKRAFHGFVRVTRKGLASEGLTAARFDMMYAIRGSTCFRRHFGSMSQRALRGALGVSAPVVSRMLRSLEQLGLVVRARDPHRDGRQRWITLTAKGRACICRACRWLLRGAERFVHEAICCGQHRDRWQRYVHMDTLVTYLEVLRRHLGDRATLSYSWENLDH